MTKRTRDPVKDDKEQAVYVLFYFFVSFFLLNTVFGVLSSSRCLLVSGIFSLFGVFIAVVTLIRIARSHPARGSRMLFNPDKLEFIILLGTSMIIALSTSALFFSIGHLVLFHTVYPPELWAAWVAMAAGVISLALMVWMKNTTLHLPEIDAHEIEFILNTCFLLSVMTMVTVVIARAGSALLDYGCAILTAFFLILYSVKFLSSSFKGLMDASCDQETVAAIEKLIQKSRVGGVLKELRVNKAGHVLEIIATLAMKGELSMKDAAKVVNNIKVAVRRKLPVPHEIFIVVTEQQ